MHVYVYTVKYISGECTYTLYQHINFILKNAKDVFKFESYLDLAWPKIKLILEQQYMLSLQQSQYNACWWSDDFSSQDISGHGIVPQSQNIPSPVWEEHYDDAIIGALASQITSLTVVYSTVYSDADQRKHQGSASLAFMRGIHRGPVNSPHKWPVTRKMFHFMMSPCSFTFSSSIVALFPTNMPYRVCISICLSAYSIILEFYNRNAAWLRDTVN